MKRVGPCQDVVRHGVAGPVWAWHGKVSARRVDARIGSLGMILVGSGAVMKGVLGRGLLWLLF